MIIDNDGRILYDRHELPSRYWEPQPDEEDLERIRKENETNNINIYGDEPLPFD